jgi:hypothetical protein
MLCRGLLFYRFVASRHNVLLEAGALLSVGVCSFVRHGCVALGDVVGLMCSKASQPASKPASQPASKPGITNTYDDL